VIGDVMVLFCLSRRMPGHIPHYSYLILCIVSSQSASGDIPTLIIIVTNETENKIVVYEIYQQNFHFGLLNYENSYDQFTEMLEVIYIGMKRSL
jgi:hypothetical protein